MLCLGSLLGLGMGTIFASFQVLGIVLVFSATLYICVRSSSASDPKCFKCLMFVLSGPVELFVLDLVMAVLTCSAVICMGVLCSFLIFLSVILFCLFVLCVM